MAYSITQDIGDGVTQNFGVSFPFISRSNVEVRVDGVEASFTWLSDSQVQITPAPPEGAVVDIRRITKREARLVDFQDGSVLTEAALDQDSDQLFYVSQEAFDAVEAAIAVDTDGKIDAQNRVIKNVAPPVDDSDAATKGWSLNSASTSAGQAASSATSAASSAATATAKASEASASATNAATSAATATTKASEASTSAATATTKAGEASTSATNAATSAATATTKASEAATSASNAASLYDSFDDRYLGAKASDPSLDNDGNTLQVGALYLNTASGDVMKYSGTSWTRITAVDNAGGNLSAAVNEAKGTAVASAATTNIWATDGNLVHITGTAAITSFGTAPQAGASRTVVIDSAGVVITHGSNLVCPGSVNLVSSAGDVLEIVADTTTQFRVESYVRAGSRVVFGSFSRDMTLAGGTQVITGLGFRPKKVNFKMAVSSTAGPNMSIGDDDGTNRNCVFDIGGDNYSASNNHSIFSFSAAGANLYQGVISAFSNDGFTITWTKSGSPSSTITIFYMAEM